MKQYKLKEVADIYSGATPFTKNKSFYEGGKISWITPKDLSGYDHKYIYSGQRNITEEGFKSCATSILPQGTVLFSSRAPIGYVAIAGTELCTNQGFKSFVCNAELLDNQYLYYYLIKNKDKLEALGNGSTFKEISRKTLAEYQIELPSIDKQRESVKDLIDLDDRYDQNCLVLQKLEELMECIYYDCFGSKAVDNESTALGNVVDVITGGTPSTKIESYWNNGIYYWYTPSDVTSNKNMISYGSQSKITISGLTNSSAKLIQPNSILMSSRATIGEAIINMFEATTNQGMLSLVLKNEEISVLQLYFWIKNNKGKIASVANGSTFKEVYKKDLEKLPISISKIGLREFNKKTKKQFSLYKSLTKENMIITELKKKIMDVKFE